MSATEPAQPVDATALHGVTVAHVGHFDPDYSRNRIMGKALERAGATVRVLSAELPFAGRAPQLFRALRRCRSDVVLVGFPGHADVPLVRLAELGRGTPLLFDAFVSLAETAEDRGHVKPGSAAFFRYELEDRVACRLATRVLLDTDAHVRFFRERTGLPGDRFRRIWVGADDDIMKPGDAPDDARFRVFVYASFIPLHGLEYVMRAAHLLERRGVQVDFQVVGGGDTETTVTGIARALDLHSVEFLGRQPYKRLPALMARSHLCLGIFGTSPKAQRVIPNKVFDALAVARPVITADTVAAREVLTHGVDAYLCRAGDPLSLADAIAELRADPAARAAIAAAGHVLFGARFSIDAISRDLVSVVREVLNGGNSRNG